MRLIDADQMAVDESEAYMSAQVQITDDLKWIVNFAAHSKIQRIIADTPTVDAVPVVRCKDCKYLVNATVNSNGFLICNAIDMEIAPEDFCSYGERRAEKEPPEGGET